METKDRTEANGRGRNTGYQRIEFVGRVLLTLSVFYLVLCVMNLADSLISVSNGTAPKTPWYVTIQIVVTIVYNCVIAFGASAMIRRSSYRWSKVACWLAVAPVLGPCFFLGVPIGIWGLIRLRDPEVRAAF